MAMIMCLLRTKSSGLYRHWEDLGLHIVGLKRRRSTFGSPSLPSTPRRVPSGHKTKSSVLYLHSPTVRPMYIVRQSGYPLIQDSLNAFGIDAPPLLTWCPNLDHLLCSSAKLTHAMKKHFVGERERTEAIKTSCLGE